MAKPRTDLTPAVRKELVDLYRSGTTPTEIQRTYSVSAGILYRVLHAANVPLRKPALAVRHGKPQLGDSGWDMATTEVSLPPIPEPEVRPATVPTRRLSIPSLEVTTDDQSTVVAATAEQVYDTVGMYEWEVRFQGAVTVEARSIDTAIAEARKLGVVRTISAALRKSRVRAR